MKYGILLAVHGHDYIHVTFFSGFFKVSSLSGRGVSDLHSSVIKCALQQPYIGEMIPESWLKAGKKMVSKRAHQSLLDWKMVEQQVNTVLDNLQKKYSYFYDEFRFFNRRTTQGFTATK